MVQLNLKTYYRGAAHSTIYVYVKRLKTNIYVKFSVREGKVTFWEQPEGLLFDEKQKIKQEILNENLR